MFDEFARNAPIRFHGLVVETTTRCNAKCGMCYQSVGPKGSDVWGKAELHEENIKTAISEAIDIEVVDPRFHLSGGEAFIDMKKCLRLFSHARSCGYEIISATTNGFWAVSEERATSVAEKLSKAGLNRLEISWDVWHLPFIKPARVNECLKACNQVGISTNLRILTTRDHSSQEALDLLAEESLDSTSEITSGPVFPTGRAATEIAQDQIYFEQNLGSACFASLNLTVNPTGRVYPCCAGADQTEALSFGDISLGSLREAVDRMQSSILLRILVFYGPGSFVGLLRKHGQELGNEFSSICHLCWSIFSDEKLDQRVRQLIEREYSNAQ